MICQVIIQDCLTERRMIYLLDDADFADQARVDPGFMQDCQQCIATVLNDMAALSDAENGDPMHPGVRQLTGLLCQLIAMLQGTHSRIDWMKITRITTADLLCDYTASIV